MANKFFTISNRTYDSLKVLVTIVLPAISALLLALSQIWGWGFGQQVDATIQAFVAFANVVLGIFVVQSSKVYAKSKDKKKTKK